MRHIILIHWNAVEARESARRLRQAGYSVDTRAPRGAAEVRATREVSPDAFVIDLSRLPSQGGAVATMLRQQRATRFVPLVFVAGSQEKVARVRETLPDALFAEWSGIGATLRQAMRHRLTAPAVPGTMDAYSGTPLPKKLGIRAGSVIALLGAPSGFERNLGLLPQGVRFVRRLRGRPLMIILFAKSRLDLARRLPAAIQAMPEGGSLWIAWPKQASAKAADLTEGHVRTTGLRAGLVDYKICAIDGVWSGLRFARRRT